MKSLLLAFKVSSEGAKDLSKCKTVRLSISVASNSISPLSASNCTKIVGSIFARLLKSKLKKDKGFKKAVDDLDKASDKLKVQIKQAQKDGIKIPPGLLVYAGLKQPR